MKTIVRAAKSAKSAQFVIAALLLMMSLSAQSAETELEAIQNSVIKIYTTQAAPDYFTPWRLLTPRQSSGSGSVIAGNRILTNAHVVANASYIQAQKHNDPKRYLARVVFVSHDADLALITVDEEGFFDDLEPLVLGELPEPQREVSVFGYPMGGKSLSITKGILSRVEQQIYAHAGSYLLAGQIDAAINPGNSGGPVMSTEKLLGSSCKRTVAVGLRTSAISSPPASSHTYSLTLRMGQTKASQTLGFAHKPSTARQQKAHTGLPRSKMAYW